MSDTAVLNEPQLRVGAHVLIQLGRELVTDVEQALLELVKNAYDADSPNCEIVVEPDFKGTVRHQGTRERLASFCNNAESVSASYIELRKGDKPIQSSLSYSGRGAFCHPVGFGVCLRLSGASAAVASISSRRIEGLAGLRDGVRAFGGIAAWAMLVPV